MLISQIEGLERASATAADTFLVGDVGGTNCRLALARRSGEQVVLAHLETHKCADFPTAESAIDSYLRSLGWNADLGAAVIAIAGPISGGVVKSTNMHWRMSEAALKGHGAQQVRLINDYTALALSVEHLGHEDVRVIGPNVQGEAGQTIAVVGAGTGFGAGALAKGVGGRAAIATEGGHISFAPVDELETEILRALTRRFGRVSIERLLSGPGLINLRQALAEIDGRPPEEIGSEGIVSAAEAGDPLSIRALDCFCSIYGSVAGDFALMYGARGGVYLGGGIAPAIAHHLERSSFRQRFEQKGRFSGYMAGVPTRIIMNTYAALLGAAFLASAIAGTDV